MPGVELPAFLRIEDRSDGAARSALTDLDGTLSDSESRAARLSGEFTRALSEH